VITIGSSAGGYAAILYGSLLECERVYAFNAQLNLKITMKNSKPNIDPILFDKQNDYNFIDYYDLSNFLNNKTEFYYFQSCYSRIDLEQLYGITKHAQKNLRTIRFLTANHGFPFLRQNLKNVFLFSSKELSYYFNKTLHPLLFSFNLIGVFPTFYFFFKALKDRYKKKQKEKMLNK